MPGNSAAVWSRWNGAKSLLGVGHVEAGAVVAHEERRAPSARLGAELDARARDACAVNFQALPRRFSRSARGERRVDVGARGRSAIDDLDGAVRARRRASCGDDRARERGRSIALAPELARASRATSESSASMSAPIRCAFGEDLAAS